MTRLAEARLALLSHNLNSIVEAIDRVNTEYCATRSPQEISPLDQLSTKIEQMRAACRHDPAASQAADAAAEILNGLQQSPSSFERQSITQERGDLRKWGRVANGLREDLLTLQWEFTEGEHDDAGRWRALEEINVRCTAVMDSYVDVLRSVAIRSAGFDGRLCEIADALIRITDYRWQSITVPAKTERMSLTGAGLVLLGLPGWTFWTLPLCLHDYAHTHFATNIDDRTGLEKLRDDADDPTWTSVIAADAFAAASAGPAYACALALARLDPAEVAADPDGLGGRRAAVVLATLRQTASVFVPKLGRREPMASALSFVDQIEQLWAESVRAHGAEDDRFLADEKLIQPTLDAVLTREVIPFDYTRWDDTVVPMSGQLNDPDADKIGRSADSDLRIVLNAGWVARVSNPEPDAELIERKATEVCLDWLDPAVSAGSGGLDFSQRGLR